MPSLDAMQDDGRQILIAVACLLTAKIDMQVMMPDKTRVLTLGTADRRLAIGSYAAGGQNIPGTKPMYASNQSLAAGVSCFLSPQGR